MKIFTHLTGFVVTITLFSCSAQNKLHGRYKDYNHSQFYPYNQPYLHNDGRYVIVPANNSNKNAVSRYPCVFNGNNAATYYVLPNNYYEGDKKINASADKVIVLNNDGTQGKTYIVIKSNNNNSLRPPYVDNKKTFYNNYNRDYRNDYRRDDNVIIIVQ